MMNVAKEFIKHLSNEAVEGFFTVRSSMVSIKIKNDRVIIGVNQSRERLTCRGYRYSEYCLRDLSSLDHCRGVHHPCHPHGSGGWCRRQIHVPGLRF